MEQQVQKTSTVPSFRHSTREDRVFQILIVIAGTIVFAVTLFPLWFVLIASFSDPASVSGGKVWFWPVGLNIDGYREILKDARIWIGYRNTIAYTIVGTLISMLVTLPCAYALSRKDFLVRTPLMIFFVITMYFSGGLVPTYILITNTLKMNNTFWVMVIPFCVNVYNLIVCRTFFSSTIPDELLDAAKIDGCTNFRFFLSVVLPLSKAILSVIMLYCIIGKWNEYFNALIYLNDPNRTTLQLVLRDILLKNQAGTGGGSTYVSESAIRLQELVKYTSIVVSSLPVLILYPFIQKYFEKGVMIGSVKG